jgi:hypothetical protein
MARNTAKTVEFDSGEIRDLYIRFAGKCPKLLAKYGKNAKDSV